MERWVLVVPVKLLAVAKTRLEPPAGVARSELALAMAHDTLTAAVAASAVAEVVVVTNEPAGAALAASLGCRTCPDAPDAGLDAALDHAAREVRADWPGASLAALSSDLPALVAAELDRALAVCGQAARAVLADAGGTGTVLLTARAPEPLAPSYGAMSLSRHVRSGAVDVTAAVDCPRLRQDVDTAVDLAAAAELGLGPATRELLARARGACA